MIRSKNEIQIDSQTKQSGKIGISLFNYHNNSGAMQFNFHPVMIPSITKDEAGDRTVQIGEKFYNLCGSQIQLDTTQSIIDAKTVDLVCKDGIACQIDCIAMDLLLTAMDDESIVVFGLKSEDFE
jgi:hypothetical protein